MKLSSIKKVSFFGGVDIFSNYISKAGYVLAGVFSLTVICVIAFFVLDEVTARFSVIALSALIVLMTQPGESLKFFENKKRLGLIFDLIIIGSFVWSAWWFFKVKEELWTGFYMATNSNVLAGLLGIISLIILTFRSWGWSLVIMAIVFIIFGFSGPWLPGLLEHFGVNIMTEASVEKVIVKNGRAVGVALENGDEYNSNIVISGLDPKLTFLKMLDEPDLPSDFVSAIKNFRIRGSSGKVNLALDALPNFTCLPGDGHHLRGAISISPSYDHLERAYDDAKYGNFSEAPFMDIILPSVLDPDMAPPGKHVMSCFVQYAPYDINGGWNDQKREAFGDAVINTIARYAPNIKDIILHRQVLTPADLESTFGLTEGNIFHGELTLQQLFSLRPAVKWADYTTPIKNYFQCGSGTHPGGGITGSPGEMAAKKILGTW